jgi:biotin carboxyl carrier protein
MLVVMPRPMSLLAALMFLGACQPLETAPPPLRPRNPANQALDPTTEPRADPGNAALKPEPTQAKQPPRAAIVPRATVEEVEPGQEALAEAILTASRTSLADCRANSGGGVLRLRVVGNKNSEKITIEPGSTVNDSVRVCVLEALSTLDVSDTLSQGSPSMRPSAGFTSIFAINW